MARGNFNYLDFKDISMRINIYMRPKPIRVCNILVRTIEEAFFFTLLFYFCYITLVKFDLIITYIKTQNLLFWTSDMFVCLNYITKSAGWRISFSSKRQSSLQAPCSINGRYASWFPSRWYEVCLLLFKE